LVSGNRAAQLTTSPGSTGFQQVEVQSPDGIQFDGTDLFHEGAIGGILTARDNVLPDILNQLDTLAKAVVDEVNAQHAAGFDFNGTAGSDFFQPIAAAAGASALIEVASAVTADPKLIAAAATSPGAPGDNRNAAALAKLRDTRIVALGNRTAEDYLLATLGDIGEDAHALQNDVDFQTGLRTQVQARREAASGVSIDEEMTNLILFQRAFEASARLVTATNELYESLIDMTR
jgi:flagellar hook-associated protein 1 FlgK